MSEPNKAVTDELFGSWCSCGKSCMVSIDAKQRAIVEQDVVLGLRALAPADKATVSAFAVGHEALGHKVTPALVEVMPDAKDWPLS